MLGSAATWPLAAGLAAAGDAGSELSSHLAPRAIRGPLLAWAELFETGGRASVKLLVFIGQRTVPLSSPDH